VTVRTRGGKDTYGECPQTTRSNPQKVVKKKKFDTNLHSRKKSITFAAAKCEKQKKTLIITNMNNRKFEDRNEPEIVYSRAVKAGKRIYYLDVKKARNEDLYLCITESKRMNGAENEAPQFEKHKLFLYKEDFAHFTKELEDVINYVKGQFGEIEEREERVFEPDAARDEASEEAEMQAEVEAPAEEEQEEKPRRSFFGFGLRK
jgi:hypothetical protein